LQTERSFNFVSISFEVGIKSFLLLSIYGSGVKNKIKPFSRGEIEKILMHK
jgi:hypothetical protein